MKEVLVRRFRRLTSSQQTKLAQTNPIDSFAKSPDLLLIDGGKGHLSVALNVLKAFNLGGTISVAAISKQKEELHLPQQKRSVKLSSQSAGMFLIQRIRDEAHRFALQHHRHRRGKYSITSQLENIPGIGPKRRKSLLRHFGSLEQIRKASLDELIAVDSMTAQSARSVKNKWDISGNTKHEL